MKDKCQMGLVFYTMYSQPSINGEGSLYIVGPIRILPYLVDTSQLGRSIWRRVFDIQRVFDIFSSIFPTY